VDIHGHPIPSANRERANRLGGHENLRDPGACGKNEAPRSKLEGILAQAKEKGATC
jgi:hypothetical protein